MTGIAGVDEAGRGAVLGPLVVAGVLVDEEGLEALRQLGVKDSKLLTPERRRELSERIKWVVLRYAYSELNPDQIDEAVLHGVKYRRLNYLEMVAMARVIEELRPERVIVDPCDVSPERCVREIRRMLPFEVEVVSERHADRIHPVVSAASILAKVRRDDRISELKERYGDLGSGYPSDPKTIRFLERLLRDRGECPSFVRASWATVRRLRSHAAR